jgi:hypothetical protein
VRSLLRGEAGPGAGKTDTLVARVAHVYLEGASPDVTVVSFTRRARAEIAERLQRKLPSPRVVTLTSFVASFLCDARRWAALQPVRLIGVDAAEVNSLKGGDAEEAELVAEEQSIQQLMTAAAQRGAAGTPAIPEKTWQRVASAAQSELRKQGAFWTTQAVRGAVAWAALRACSSRDSPPSERELLRVLDAVAEHLLSAEAAGSPLVTNQEAVLLCAALLRPAADRDARPKDEWLPAWVREAGSLVEKAAAASIVQVACPTLPDSIAALYAALAMLICERSAADGPSSSAFAALALAPVVVQTGERDSWEEF